MSGLFKIKSGFSTYTETEKRLATYILNNKDKTINLSAQELSQFVNTSPAAIIRFSQKLGYKGFTAMKVDLAKDNTTDDYDFDELINTNDDYETLVRKLYTSNLKTLDNTYKLINPVLIEEAVNILINARHIYLLGVGASGIVCDDLLYKLSRINRSVFRYSDTHVMLSSIANISSNDVIIAISYKGQTKEVNAAVEYGKQVGAKSIAITSYRKSPLSRLADFVLYIPTEEKEIRLGAVSSRFSSLILTDLLYFSIAKIDIEDTRQKIVKTHDIIKKLK